MKKLMPEEIIIIGAGPAGAAAAVQLKRSGFDPLIFEKEETGGLLRNANLVENYPGFPGGIPGGKFAALLEKHLGNLNVRMVPEEVAGAALKGGYFHISTRKRDFESRTLIVASGTGPKKFSHPCVNAEIENRIFYCVHPFARTRGKRFAVIGSGDIAFDFALNLSKKNDVLIVNGKSESKCLSLLGRRASENGRIVHLTETAIRGISLEGEGLLLSLNRKKSGLEEPCDFIIAAIGREPEMGFLGAEIFGALEELRREGRIHLIGDVKNGIYRQAAIAAGDGIRAAMEIAVGRGCRRGF